MNRRKDWAREHANPYIRRAYWRDRQLTTYLEENRTRMPKWSAEDLAMLESLLLLIAVLVGTPEEGARAL